MEPRNRFGAFQKPLLLATAISLDLIQALLSLLVVGVVLNGVVSLFAWLSYYLWYKVLDIGFLDVGVRKILTFMGGGLLEMIPIVNTLPSWTISVILIIFIVAREDALYNKERKHKLAEAQQRLVDIPA